MNENGDPFGTAGLAVRRRRSIRQADPEQNVRHLAADRAHRGDGGDGNQRQDHGELDHGRAPLVFHHPAEERQHSQDPKDRTLLQTVLKETRTVNTI